MSKYRKNTYMALIALGGVALLADRFLMSESITGPEPVLASGTAGSEPMSSGDLAPTASETAIPELIFPRNIPATYREETLRDIFTPPASVVTPDAGTDHARGGGTRADVALARAAFIDQHRLSGVIVYGHVKVAIVDNRWVQTGQSIDGCSLEALSGEVARFSCHDGDALLSVKSPISSED